MSEDDAAAPSPSPSPAAAGAAGLRQLDAVAARLFTAGKKLEVSDPAGAVAKWRVSAALGNARGQTNLGFMHETGGGGLAKDDTEAVRWYRKSAAQDNAQDNLKSRGLTW